MMEKEEKVQVQNLVTANQVKERGKRNSMFYEMFKLTPRRYS